MGQILKNGSDKMKEIVGFTNLPLVSIDFLHRSESTIIDSLETIAVDENLCRVVSWYDNEWGFVCRMLDILTKLMV